MSRPAGYLLDTNVLSETRQVRPNFSVISFLERVEDASLFISALTIGELAKGVEKMGLSDPYAAALISGWVESIEIAFADRILPIDSAVSRRWSRLAADRPRPVIDTLLAATALVHNLTLVTRNAGDLDGIAISLVDPWAAEH